MSQTLLICVPTNAAPQDDSNFCHVNFPLTLDLGKYCSPPAEAEVKYDLTAFVVRSTGRDNANAEGYRVYARVTTRDMWVEVGRGVLLPCPKEIVDRAMRTAYLLAYSHTSQAVIEDFIQ